MRAQVSLKIPPIQMDLLELEEHNNSGHGNRTWIRARITEMRSAIEAEANPVLRADYLRRLRLIEGTASR